MSVNRILAGAAIVLAVLAAFARSPSAGRDAGRLSVVDLAEWLRDRRTMRVVDLRDSAAFAEFHLPQGIRMSAAQHTSLTIGPGETLVLYDGGDGLARETWRSVESASPDVYWLADGVTEWVDEIMNPTIAPDATPREREAFERLAELSRYFGGMPRVSAVGDHSGTARERFERTVRRGCAF